jgi:4-amino-4-deoxy-L-arabinose transferase-like glycosyltransferase
MQVFSGLDLTRPAKLSTAATDSRQSIVHIAIIVLVSLAIGIYLLLSTVTIAWDSVIFIDFAKHITQTPIESMQVNYQHPGYPFLIRCAQPIFAAFGFDDLWSWHYAAQTTALICRVLCLLVVYLIGRKIVGARASFWAVLILLFLHDSAQTGSNGLSEWPCLLFMSLSYLAVYKAMLEKKSYWLIPAAALAGIAYLIRPEGIQVFLCAVAAYIIYMLKPRYFGIAPAKIAISLILAILVFGLVAGPYMKLKNSVFPKKSLQIKLSSIPVLQPTAAMSVSRGAQISTALVGAGFVLFKRLFEAMIFFAPFWAIGIFAMLKKRSWRDPDKQLSILVITINIAVLLTLYADYGYIDRRHLLPLITLTCFYIPYGIYTIIRSFAGFKLFPESLDPHPRVRDSVLSFAFAAAVFVGVAVELPRTLKQPGANWAVIRDISAWISANTPPNSAVMCWDTRIAFYSHRPSAPTLEKAKYAVFRTSDIHTDSTWERVFSATINKRSQIIVFRKSDNKH